MRFAFATILVVFLLPTSSSAATVLAQIPMSTPPGTSTVIPTPAESSPPSDPASTPSPLGPMPVTPPIAPAGTPVERQTPDRPIDQSLVRPASYTLSPGDRINVAIANVPEYSNVYQVMMDGCITLPVVGALDVQGMTETQAALAIAQRYTETQVLVQPTVTVILAEMSQVHVAVLGEVNRPGAYLITPPNGELPKLTQMIEQAGGITPHTNLKAIEIHRPLRDGTMQVIAANLWSLLTTGDLSQDIAIRDGDTVMLKPATDMPLEVALSVSRANVTPSDIQVNILGEVTSPGVQTLVSGTSLNQALMFAGGFTGRARRRSVELIRLNVNGTVSRRRVEIDLDQSINEDSNPILQSQDVILVNRSLEARITDTIGNILSPINSIFSLFDVFSPFLGR